MVDFSPGNNDRSTLIINVVAILFLEQPREHTVLTLQHLVGPLLNNTSFFEHNDFIHIAQRTQAVRNHQDGAPHHRVSMARSTLTSASTSRLAVGSSSTRMG